MAETETTADLVQIKRETAEQAEERELIERIDALATDVKAATCR